MRNSAWSFVLVVVLLLGGVVVGVWSIVSPDRFTHGRRGGEMLTEWNQLGTQFGGAIFAAVAAYMLYGFVADCL
jgi:hypothetical protein